MGGDRPLAYTKTVWVENSAPGISASNLNKIEQGIADAHALVEQQLAPSETSAALAPVFGSQLTVKRYIKFSPAPGSNDPGFIMHETSGASGYVNIGVIHICPSDDNNYSDYVVIHGTNDPEMIRFHTDGTIEVLAAGKGIVLTTPDGTKRFRITVNNNGDLVTTQV